jgi:TetR/AcrR family transcriptional regulator, repressor of fatR-cypB operon
MNLVFLMGDGVTPATKKRSIDPDGKKAAILQAAAAQFATYGFEGANTAKIASDAGVGAGTIFRFFPTKEDLANAVYTRGVDFHLECHVTAGITTSSNKSSREQFSTLFNLTWEYAVNFPNEYIFFDRSSSELFLTDLNRHLANKIRTNLVHWLKELQRRQVIIQSHEDVILTLVVGALNRFIRRAMFEKVRIPKEYLTEIEALCWKAISC